MPYIRLLIFAAAISALPIPPIFASDTILLHGHVYTGNPQQKWAQALAISGTRIDSVGSDDEIARVREPRTKIIDLKGRTVIPGIVDSHTHMWFGALALHGFNLATPETWIDPKNEDLFISHIRAYAKLHPKDEVLFGRAVFGNGVSHELLDRAVSDRPIVIHAATEHTWWVNGKALAMAGITDKPFADPAIEKFIVRDAKGRPTGVLRESAMQVMERALPPQPLEEKLAWLREAAHYLNRFGITGVTNATGSLAEIQLYGMLRDRGQLTVRTRTAFGAVAVKQNLTPAFLAQLEQARTTFHDDWVSANLVKFFADGAGGPALYDPAEYTALVLELDKRGYQVMTHAIGAGPAHMVLDAYERAEKENGPKDRRFRMEHAINVSAEDVPRLAKLSVTPSMQAAFCCFNDGPGNRTNVWQTFEKSGAGLAFGSDWPCSWPPDPFEGIQQSATRVVRQLFTAPSAGDRQAAYTSPEQRLTVEQAVDAYTRGSAYARFSDTHIGTLEPGKEADIAVLSQDIFAARTEDIGKTHVLMTLVGGKTVFQAK